MAKYRTSKINCAIIGLDAVFWKENLLKLINNSSRENKENHYRDHGLDMCS